MKLGVNIDHVATLRQQRQEKDPDPVEAALVAQRNGADSIVAHLREDRRHIQDHDVQRLRRALKIPLNLEMGATPEMERIALALKPARVCLVPEKRQELTTEGGLNVVAARARLRKMTARFSAKKIGTSLFIDPDAEQVHCARDIGAYAVELHTGSYALATGKERQRELARLVRASALATELGLRLHAGHGLDYENVRPVAAIDGMEELNIGFSIITRAVFVGLASAVREMKALIRRRSR